MKIQVETQIPSDSEMIEKIFLLENSWFIDFSYRKKQLNLRLVFLTHVHKLFCLRPELVGGLWI